MFKVDGARRGVRGREDAAGGPEPGRWAGRGEAPNHGNVQVVTVNLDQGGAGADRG